MSIVRDGMGGVYFLYNAEHELIYVGRSICIKKRLIEHFNGATHTFGFYKEFAFFRFLYTDSRVEQKTYELYAINILKPKYNKLDVYDDVLEVKTKTLDEIEKETLAAFVLKFLKMNKGVPVDLFVVKQVCENNNYKNINLLDVQVLNILKENGIRFANRKFIYD